MENQFDSIACEVKLIRELADQPNVDDEEVCLKPVRNGPQVQLQTGESTTENPSASEGTSNLVGQRMDHSEAADSSVSFDESKQIENQLLYLFPCIDVFAIPFFVVFFCNDVFVNILLAKSYYDDGMTFECILTASVVATAFLVTGILNLFWHTQEKHRRNICLFGSDVPIFATIERLI
ncbi:uncharacterized protein LOC134275899 [Saccostrea cucullata]|uniref:uncharacterized protein LOC134275899 n=1 Tax=Saccostrea cuccullata TaxID=36930 RepID=UPI002ED471FD